MNIYEEGPDNIIPISPEIAGGIEIRAKHKRRVRRCAGHHKQIEVDTVTRTVRCRECGHTVDPFDYLAGWADDTERRLQGLHSIEIQRRIAQAEHDDLMRKVKNLRQRLKRAGEPQPKEERAEYDKQRWNPERFQ